MLVQFQDKRVVVVGAARGIGRAIAEAFAERGAQVCACDLLLDELERYAGRARSGGGEIRAAYVDVTDPDSVARVVGAAALRAKAVDVLVYVPGGVRGPSPP